MHEGMFSFIGKGSCLAGNSISDGSTNMAWTVKLWSASCYRVLKGAEVPPMNPPLLKDLGTLSSEV